ELRPPPSGVVIVGENGHGKTNLLEAAYYFMLLRSSRGARDSDMVQFGRDGFFISAELEGGSAREVSVGFEKQGKRKRVRMDGAEVPRMSSALGSLPSVMVSPRDVSLVSGSPSERRRFLDVVLAVTRPSRRARSEEHTSELQSRENLVCRLLLEQKKKDDGRKQETGGKQTHIGINGKDRRGIQALIQDPSGDNGTQGDGDRGGTGTRKDKQ